MTEALTTYRLRSDDGFDELMKAETLEKLFSRFAGDHSEWMARVERTGEYSARFHLHKDGEYRCVDVSWKPPDKIEGKKLLHDGAVCFDPITMIED